ncbi:hypothetical protein V498_08701 [Pseudogymnoascus sp. VKM F-4517 (FW-2822)]|nr:hypothetical protein V498_08701 [Pseudogymnoascus sp. VKM F-4517 (FW-2822)]
MGGFREEYVQAARLVHTLETDYPRRPGPGVVLASLARKDLERMTAQTRLVVNVAGVSKLTVLGLRARQSQY